MNDLSLHLESSYTDLPDVFFSRLIPTPVKKPELVILNKTLAEEIGMDLSGISRNQLAELFSGNLIPKNTSPFAQAYAGHQFGNFTMLGDGRAIILGEHMAPSERRIDIQLKGSGRTPYSRGGDGRAALGPMLREYIISEAMHALGIPTTRSLAVVKTGEIVYREQELTGAILTRTASSHIRVGTFEFASLQDDKKCTQSLLNYLIERHFPKIREEQNQAIALMEAVIHQQADLITQWMRVGFIHGVMNTDNMALCGETIDYGPCAFMDTFAPDTVFSSIDHRGRYAYANQPYIAQWNLARLAETLLAFIDPDRKKAIEIAENCLNSFEKIYKEKWLTMMGTKIGLKERFEGDEKLISELLDWMHKNSADFTNTFINLGKEKLPDFEAYATKDFQSWHSRWQERIRKEKQDRTATLALMNSVNPLVIPRNHKVEEALQAAEENDLQPFHNLLQSLEKPYENNGRLDGYQSPPKPEEKVHQTFCGT